MDIKLTKKQKLDFLYMIMLGESVLSLRAYDQNKNSRKYESIIDKVYSWFASDKDGREFVEKYQDKWVPTDDISETELQLLTEYDDENFWDQLINELGKRDFLEQAPKEELDELYKRHWFPSSLSKYEQGYDKEFAKNGLHYLRLIPPALLTKLRRLTKIKS